MESEDDDERFHEQQDRGWLQVKLWRGERMALIGMDVADPEDDLVGFAIAVN